MADILINSSLTYDRKFFLPSVQADNVDDPFVSTIPCAEPASMWRKNRIQPISPASSSGGCTVTFQIPNNVILGDIILETQLGSSSGSGYAGVPCSQIFTNVKIINSGNELMNFPYRQVHEYITSTMPNELRSLWQTLEGGTSSSTSAVTGYAICPTFWGSFKHSQNDWNANTLPLLASNSYLQIELQVDSIANILASGGSGGSITAINMIYYSWITTQEENQRIIKTVKDGQWNYFGLDYQPFPQVTVASTSSATTQVNLSGLQGSCVELSYYSCSATDIDTNHEYTKKQNSLIYVDLQVDGNSIYSSVTGGTNERQLENVIWNASKWGSQTTYGLCSQINFTRRKDAHCYNGGLNSNCFKTLNLFVEQTSGSNQYVFVTAILQRYYIFDGNSFVRVKS